MQHWSAKNASTSRAQEWFCDFCWCLSNILCCESEDEMIKSSIINQFRSKSWMILIDSRHACRVSTLSTFTWRFNFKHSKKHQSKQQEDYLTRKKMPKFCAVEKLVSGFNPFEKYARQNGNLPQIGLKIKKCLSCHHPEKLALNFFLGPSLKSWQPGVFFNIAKTWPVFFGGCWLSWPLFQWPPTIGDKKRWWIASLWILDIHLPMDHLEHCWFSVMILM